MYATAELVDRSQARNGFKTLRHDPKHPESASRQAVEGRFMRAE